MKPSISKYLFFVAIFAAVLSMSCNKEVRKNRKLSLKGGVAEKDSAAFFYYGRGDYEKAAFLFEELLGYYRSNTRYQDVLYHLAYCRYNQRRYLEASEFFDQFTKRFPNVERTEECAFLLAVSFYKQTLPHYLDQTPTLKAMDQLQYFLVSYPFSENKEQCEEYINSLRERLAKKALERAKLYYKTGDYRAAVTSFEVFLQEFPDSQYREEGHYTWFLAAADFGHNSTERRKENRYKDALDVYDSFLERYPSSPYLKDAESNFAKVRDELEELYEKTGALN